jgi:dolichyl-phosphate-mannose-protein mannosyltransferase
LAYGSVVSIKNYGRGGALLHSHVQVFPEGSGQQQVTAYPHKDSNNNWIVLKGYGAPEPEKVDIEFVKDREVIRLRTFYNE